MHVVFFVLGLSLQLVFLKRQFGTSLVKVLHKIVYGTELLKVQSVVEHLHH